MLNRKLIPVLALMCAAGMAQAKGLPSSLSFDGYCDGVTGLTSDGATVVATHAYAACSGYSDSAMSGPAGKSLGGASGKGASLGDGSYPTLGYTLVYAINLDGTWTLYSPEYGGLINSGTWTQGYNGSLKGGNGKPSSLKK